MKRPARPRPLPPVLELMIGAGLLGIVLLSAGVYYRSVRIQRFWEPALAMSNPRVEFAEGVRNRFQEVFESEEMPGVYFSGDSVFVDAGLVAASEVHGGRGGPQTMGTLAVALKAVLESPALRNYFDMILVSTFFPLKTTEAPFSNRQRRLQQYKSEALLDKLYSLQPVLFETYGHYFVATALPVDPTASLPRFVEFRFVPAGRQHIRVLQDLEEYSR